MTDIERRVGRLDNDVEAIYGLLEKMDERLDKHGGMLRRQGNRLDMIEGELQSVNDGLTAVNGRLDDLSERWDTLMAYVDEGNGRTARVEEKLEALLALLEAQPPEGES